MTKETFIGGLGTLYEPIPYTACWEWLGYVEPDGYGQVRYDGKMQMAHRVMYKIAKGPIPEGMFVCHTCDNPGCVNPEHLWVGTPRDNMVDMVNKGRNRNTKGERNSSARLTEDIVREIRQHDKAHSMTPKEIADHYGISVSHTRNILAGVFWKCV